MNRHLHVPLAQYCSTQAHCLEDVEELGHDQMKLNRITFDGFQMGKGKDKLRQFVGAIVEDSQSL